MIFKLSAFDILLIIFQRLFQPTFLWFHGFQAFHVWPKTLEEWAQKVIHSKDKKDKKEEKKEKKEKVHHKSKLSDLDHLSWWSLDVFLMDVTGCPSGGRFQS